MTADRAAMFDGLTDLQPGIIFNNRLIYGKDGVYGEAGDLRTPEQHIPSSGTGLPLGSLPNHEHHLGL